MTSHVPPATRYVHGTSPVEQQRLSQLNDLLNERCLREVELHAGERVVDFGSGLGQLTRALARGVGTTGRVLGIDGSAAQIATARELAHRDGEAALVEFRHGDVASPPLAPGEWGTFDVAHARFVLEHVTDPQAVVAHMVRAVRPGGRIVLVDDDHDVLRMWPEPARVLQAWRAYTRTYDRNGTDPFIGRRLVELLHAAGARPARATMVFFGACTGDPHFAATITNLRHVLAGAQAPILATGAIDAAGFAAALAELTAWSARPDAAVWFALPWAMGVRG
jgi:SAM-dependent methyltransferase